MLYFLAGHLWPFQLEAVEAIEKAIMDRRRHMLVAMATGTGQTFTITIPVQRKSFSGPIWLKIM